MGCKLLRSALDSSMLQPQDLKACFEARLYVSVSNLKCKLNQDVAKLMILADQVITDTKALLQATPSEAVDTRCLSGSELMLVHKSSAEQDQTWCDFINRCVPQELIMLEQTSIVPKLVQFLTRYDANLSSSALQILHKIFC